MTKRIGRSDKSSHWERVYQTNHPQAVSWFQKEPTISIQLVQNSGVKKTDPIIDVGGGASTLVDCLASRGYANLTVLDISSAAIELSRERLGAASSGVAWYTADITSFEPPDAYFLWHDRAVFHFLTKRSERKKYVEVLKWSVPTNGHVIIATFSVGGPEKCSGLEIVQYDALKLLAALGDGFQFIEEIGEIHITPQGREQKFSYFRMLRL